MTEVTGCFAAHAHVGRCSSSAVAQYGDRIDFRKEPQHVDDFAVGRCVCTQLVSDCMQAAAAYFTRWRVRNAAQELVSPQTLERTDVCEQVGGDLVEVGVRGRQSWAEHVGGAVGSALCSDLFLDSSGMAAG